MLTVAGDSRKQAAYSCGTVDGVGTYALLNQVRGIAIDSKGNIFLTEKDSCLVRRVTPNFYQVTTIAGGGIPGALVDGVGQTAR